MVQVQHELVEHVKKPKGPEFCHRFEVLESVYGVNRSCRYFDATRANTMSKMINTVREKFAFSHVQCPAGIVEYFQNLSKMVN